MKTTIPKGKQRQLMLVALVTAGVLAGIWFGLIGPQRQGLADLATSIDATRHQVEVVSKVVAAGDKLEAELATASGTLGAIEDEMATGDLLSWVVNTIRRFKPAYNVDVPQFGQPTRRDMSMLPKFPYQQVTVNIAGTAFYQDLGEFIAGFENQFPYTRIEQLEITPAPPATSAAEPEKLAFHMDIVALVKPGS